MTPQTPRGRFCNNGSVSTFPPPTGIYTIIYQLKKLYRISFEKRQIGNYPQQIWKYPHNYPHRKFAKKNRKINENSLKVSGEWIQGYMTKEKNAKKIVKSFMTHILMNITSPPENIKKFPIRTSRNTKSGYEELPADVTHEIITAEIRMRSPEWNEFIKDSSSIYYRALVRNQPFQSTSSSHPGPQKSQMHFMTFRKRRNTTGFGSVCLFMIRGGQSYVLIEEYRSAAALRLDFSKLARNTQRLARSTKLFADNNCDSHIVKCTNLIGLTLIPTSDVLSPFLSIQFDGNTYFCPIRYSPSVVR
ncbi:Protein CBG16706 [Caenorhabditis briggsae]|uniref:Protein CBG16706 n=1 Tax=Caenorhabditis briggsae TaxID=6238 RepID=A8XPN5_CAEBR|nr:Protein CBG16706 [Caenorhabditis briggsae]CAP34611.1 Protein CBG16706 [Caenorhabditis briggsae]